MHAFELMSRPQIAHRSLLALREHVEQEGPSTIAAILMESVTGTNGIYKAPRGYLKGMHALIAQSGTHTAQGCARCVMSTASS